MTLNGRELKLKRIATLAVIPLFFACSAAIVQSPQSASMADPLFGISYDPQKVTFGEAPAKIRMLCSYLGDPKLWKGKLWMYGSIALAIALWSYGYVFVQFGV